MIKERFLIWGLTLACVLPALCTWLELRATNTYLIFAVSIARTGEWSLRFLLLTLLCTPLQQLAGSAWPRNARRTLGLAAFAYALAHVFVYLHVGQHWNGAFMVDDALRQSSRPPGWVAFALLLPLALTSTDAAMRRLGGVRWKGVHRLVYAAMLLSVTHLALVDHENSDVYTRTKQIVGACVIVIVTRIVVRSCAKSPSPRATDENARR